LRGIRRRTADEIRPVRPQRRELVSEPAGQTDVVGVLEPDVRRTYRRQHRVLQPVRSDPSVGAEHHQTGIGGVRTQRGQPLLPRRGVVDHDQGEIAEILVEHGGHRRAQVAGRVEVG
jgi:hypothetical protein